MHRRGTRLAAVLAVACLMGFGAVACGSSDDNAGSSSNKTSGSEGGGKEGGSITVLIGTAPDFLDPAQAYTTQAAEVHWLSYMGLLSYKHAAGSEGGQLIPALAESLPQVSEDGKTYTLKLRQGLVFSDGSPVKASDFKASVERMIKANWGGKSFVTGYVKGAADFDKDKAKDISGITADDATGEVTITLDTPYGAFSNVLAFPSLGVVPKGTTAKNLSNDPPPGVGPYMLTDIQVNRTYTLSKNPKFAGLKIPEVPTGHLDKIVFKVTSNTQSEAQQVLNDQADVFDAGDTLPPALLPQIQSKAKDRFKKQAIPSTFYFFLNTKLKPFDNDMAREAVNLAIDRQAMSRLASGFLKPACYFIPEGIVGHPGTECAVGDLNKPDLAKAKQLVQQSGTAGTKITVWGMERVPRKQYVEYYAELLNQLGYKATPKIISDEVYWSTIGNAKTKPQTGFADWIQDFPNPSDFFFLLDGKSIQPLNNQNFSQIDDPKINDGLAKLNPVPATELSRVASQWEELDRYQASKNYQAIYGTQQVPQFYSSRIDFGTAIFHPTYYTDWSSLQLKG
jgi:peptide/nickel transport system substrate-binding protein